jgi:hypothetical protein
MNRKIKIFVSYSHKNKDWVDETGKYRLIPWLKDQLKRKHVEFWTDHALQNHVGEEYRKNIRKNIDEADIALLLISQDFASSDFINEFELPWIHENYKEETIKVIPLLIQQVSEAGKEDISWIFDLQTIPNDIKPIIEFYGHDAEWTNIKNNILDAIYKKIKTIQETVEQEVSLPKQEVDNLENISECHSADTKQKVDVVNKDVEVAETAEMENIEPEVTTPKQDYKSESIKEFIIEILSKEKDLYDIYISPNIKNKKIKAALKYYVTLSENEEIIALYDSTVFGKADEGIVFSTDTLYGKDNINKTKFDILYSDITDIKTDKNYIVVNDNYRIYVSLDKYRKAILAVISAIVDLMK